jgi:hypothetical protein
MPSSTLRLLLLVLGGALVGGFGGWCLLNGSIPGEPIQLAENLLIVPPESTNRSEELQSPGFWHTIGKDQAGNEWDGYLVVDQADGQYMRRGYFQWGTQGAGASYHFKGTYDPATRLVRWSAYSLEDKYSTPTLRPALAVYEATLSPDGTHFVNGKWSSMWCIPGNWTAELTD